MMPRGVLRSLYHRGVDAVASRDVLWRILDRSLLRVARRLDVRRRALVAQRDTERHAAHVREFLDRASGDLRVRHGPFAGLRYPQARATGSMLCPKLLGTYESELHPLMEWIVRSDYRCVVDVGCAEGYYAVGLARRLPDARVVAYDSDRAARELCTEMAALNGVADRVRVAGACRAEDLVDLPARSLVISDCEGHEKALFTPRVVDALAAHDCLIEAHEFIDPCICAVLEERFRATHDVERIASISDVDKARRHAIPELAGRSESERRDLLAERRPGTMHWLFMRARRREHPARHEPRRS